MMFIGNGKLPTLGSNVPMGNEVVKFHEENPYGLGHEESITLHGFRQRELIQNLISLSILTMYI